MLYPAGVRDVRGETAAGRDTVGIIYLPRTPREASSLVLRPLGALPEVSGKLNPMVFF